MFERWKTAWREKGGWKAIARAVGLIAGGFLVAWLLLPSRPRDAGTATLPATGHEHHAEQRWTCSMHPQIQRPGPGKCPICGMDLIPVGRSGATLTSLRQLEVSPAARELMSVEVRPVERRFVTAEVRLVGKVAYDETRLRQITAWISGRLDRLYVDFTGIQVREGDHMVHIYSPELYSAQQELISAARSAREREQSGRRPLAGIDLLESAREKLQLLGLSDEQIREIEQQDRPSSHLTIYAPMGGVVIEKLRRQGDYVQTGDQIYTLADLSQVWVELDAYESDLVWLRYGQEMQFSTEAYPGETFSGRIAFINPILDDRTRTVSIRANVPNPEGKLKPSMFVRGTVRAEVAGGGRVIDADLAGKWIGPMHPEIVKDEPGSCDICGMPLVRAESLGYVSHDDVFAGPPLVIPKSAVLWTGTRAIVYVEVPDTEQPTYEGREIVLGPRAGDHYLVRSGLRDGELVVVRGNFKIDSALQIQARPSMMTPEGGGGGGHQHDHGEPTAGEQPPREAMTQVAPEFFRQLQQVRTAAQELFPAVEAEDIAGARQAYRQMGTAVDAVDPELVRGHPAMVWKELRMLLRNDVAEAQDADDLQTIVRLAENTAGTMDQLREQLRGPQREHLEHADRVQEDLEVLEHFDVPDSFQTQFANVLKSYFSLQSALADSDLESAKRVLKELGGAVEQVDDQELAEPVRRSWEKERENLRTILGSMQQQETLQGVRQSFAQLSGEMEALVYRFGAGSAGPVYRVHCPMALSNQGAWWLQQSDEIRNPYFGDAMLKCHDRFEKIASGEADVPEESGNG